MTIEKNKHRCIVDMIIPTDLVCVPFLTLPSLLHPHYSLYLYNTKYKKQLKIEAKVEVAVTNST